MEDPKGLVFTGRDDSGAAVVFPDRKPLTQDAFDLYKARLKDDGKTATDRNPDMALRNVTAQMQKAWSIDYEDLQEDFNTNLLPKLRAYESETNKSRKRELWYDFIKEQGRLNNLINKSAQTEKAYIRQMNDIKSDQIGAYDQAEALAAMDQFTTATVKDRPDVPGIQKASKVSATDWLIKNVEYAPEVKKWFQRNNDGTYKGGERVYVDEADLKKSIQARIPTMPANQRNVLYAETLPAFRAANPTAIAEPADVQAKKFNDFVVDAVYNGMVEGIKKGDKTVVSYKKTDGGNLNLDFGAAAAASSKAIYTVQKVDNAGTYKIIVQDTGTKSPADNKVMEWAISGAEYKEITGDDNPSIKDDELMTIKGRLRYIQVNEKDDPVLGIAYEEVVAPDIGGLGQDGATLADLAALKLASKFKRGTIVHVRYAYENKANVLEYGADPIRDIYPAKKKEADEEWEKTKPLNPKKTTQSGGSPQSTKSKVGQRGNTPLYDTDEPKKPTKGKLY